MDLLALLFPKVRAEVLRLLFANTAAELHLRDLTRRSGLALGTIQTELAKLAAAQLVVSERDGNRLYYRANVAHPLFRTLQQLVLHALASADIPPSASSLPGSAAPSDAHTTLPSIPASHPAPALHGHSLTLNEID